MKECTQQKTFYFAKPGETNTRSCLEIALEAQRNAGGGNGYEHVVVATTSGSTGYLFSEAFNGRGINLVVVTHSYGFKEPNSIELTREYADKITASGARIYTATMVTHSLETAFVQRFNGLYPTLVVAQTLRRFGEGPKVCCEMVMMAVDGGMIPEGVEVLTVAGTGRGADTVMVIRSAASKRFFDLKVLEIIAKPRG